MGNIDNVIELKRGILTDYSEQFMEQIASLDRFEEFYKDIFTIYDVPFKTSVIRQKRKFVAKITGYFLVNRLPHEVIALRKKYVDYMESYDIKPMLSDLVDKFYKILGESQSKQEFKEKYAKHFGIEVKDFSYELSQNRNDALTSFERLLEQVYNYKDSD